MLRELHIKNVAVIEEVTVSFGEGFHVLTGETGAGKSILIDSINMALGERTSKDMIRTGADCATVDLVFEPNDAIAEKLNEMGLPTEDGLLYISRQLQADGKGKCRVNGRLVPQSQLRDAAALLLTIHGQNDNQSLLSPKSHIDFVDAYGGYADLLQEYRSQYEKTREIERRLSSLVTDENEKLRRIDLLSYQIQEIERGRLQEGEEEELEAKVDYLTNIEQIMENSTLAYQALYGNEEQSAAYDQIAISVRRLESVCSYDQKLEGYYQSLTSVLAELEDVTHELKGYLDGIDYQQGELDEIQSRLSLIKDLKRKYGSSVTEVLAYYTEIKEELSQIENSDAMRLNLETELEQEQAALEKLGRALTEKRKEAAIHLQTAVMEELSDLDMQKMRFSVSILPMEDEEKGLRYTAIGCDRVEFLISANPGESLKPLAKIASGGEMSRIMLAMKSVLAESDAVETLIFDEIDTGVSGRAAQKIAEKICRLAGKRQILCITHLAQIAGMADVHFLIEKESQGEKTMTSVIHLNQEMREKELARIIGGVQITDLTRQAAREMLELAEKQKEMR